MIIRDPRVSIGVLAHNEAPRIAKTLQALFAQDVFQKFSTELVIVANGCTDGTAEVTRRLLADYHLVWSTCNSARVEELGKAGKANAWNHFVHDLSSPQASVLVLMDADITLLTTNTISSMISTLQSNPEAVACVDRPVKDIQVKPDRSFFQHLLVAATPELDPDNLPLCGQLYCARSASVRLIKLPLEITCEDGFLRALLITQGFTGAENPRLIVLDPSVSHSFTSVSSLSELFRHEVWIVAGSIINVLLYQRFWAECTAGRSAMTLMKAWQEQDPEWLPRYINSRVRESGWRLLPGPWWTRRWSRISKLPLRRRLARFPVALVASAMDILIFVAAIRNVRQGRAFRYWGRK
jgi:glycosyltransferase involved in cell wall biosynthesis